MGTPLSVPPKVRRLLYSRGYDVVAFRVPRVGECFVNSSQNQILTATAQLVPIVRQQSRFIVQSVKTLRELERDLLDLQARVEERRAAVEAAQHIVQVSVNSPRSYAYRDPSGTLQVGDAVQVPYGSSNRSRLGFVTELGRGSYIGPFKDVIARAVMEPLS